MKATRAYRSAALEQIYRYGGLVLPHIKDMVENCPTYVRVSTPRREPLLPTDLLEKDWDRPIFPERSQLSGCSRLLFRVH